MSLLRLNGIRGSSSVDGATFQTASIAPGSGSLVLIGLLTTHAAPVPSGATSVNGVGHTNGALAGLQPFATLASPGKQIELWVARGGVDVGPTTITYPFTATSCTWQIMWYSGADITQGIGGIIQTHASGSNSGTATANGSLLNPFGSAANGTLALSAQDSQNVISTPATGFAQANIGAQTVTTPSGSLSAQDRVTNSTTFSTVWSGAATYGVLMAEIATITTGQNRPMAGKAGTATSAKASTLTTTAHQRLLSGKAAIATSAKQGVVLRFR